MIFALAKASKKADDSGYGLLRADAKVSSMNLSKTGIHACNFTAIRIDELANFRFEQILSTCESIHRSDSSSTLGLKGTSSRTSVAKAFCRPTNRPKSLAVHFLWLLTFNPGCETPNKITHSLTAQSGHAFTIASIDFGWSFSMASYLDRTCATHLRSFGGRLLDSFPLPLFVR